MKLSGRLNSLCLNWWGVVSSAIFLGVISEECCELVYFLMRHTGGLVSLLG